MPLVNLMDRVKVRFRTSVTALTPEATLLAVLRGTPIADLVGSLCVSSQAMASDNSQVWELTLGAALLALLEAALITVLAPTLALEPLLPALKALRVVAAEPTLLPSHAALVLAVAAVAPAIAATIEITGVLCARTNGDASDGSRQLQRRCSGVTAHVCGAYKPGVNCLAGAQVRLL